MRPSWKIYIFNVTREAVEPRSTCWAKYCFLPHRKRNLLHAVLRRLKWHFLSGIRWSLLFCLRHGWLVEMERDGGYRSAITHQGWGLTKMKRVTMKGYGNKTLWNRWKTDPPTAANQYQKPTQTPELWKIDTKCSTFIETAFYMYEIQTHGPLIGWLKPQSQTTIDNDWYPRAKDNNHCSNEVKWATVIRSMVELGVEKSSRYVSDVPDKKKRLVKNT